MANLGSGDLVEPGDEEEEREGELQIKGDASEVRKETKNETHFFKAFFTPS